MNNGIDELCPDHVKASKAVGLSPKMFPSSKEIPIKNDIDKLKMKSKEDKKKKRNVYFFCIGTCNTCSLRNTWNNVVPIHVVLKWLRDKYNLKWSRISMSHHGFSNLGEIFQGDLNNKLMKNITSKDFTWIQNAIAITQQQWMGNEFAMTIAGNQLQSVKPLARNVDVTVLEILNKNLNEEWTRILLTLKI